MSKFELLAFAGTDGIRGGSPSAVLAEVVSSFLPKAP